MSSLLLDRPDLRVFWSAFDPLDLASDSIDPLGFTAGYISLADQLLPGFTTITTVPRYAPLLCYALRRARDASGDGSSNVTVRRRRMIEAIKCVERAWALSCGVSEHDVGSVAVAGVRGIRAVHRWLSAHKGKERISIGFALLSNQVRYGGIGAYGTFLESMHLADMGMLTLRPLGEALADAFPKPDDADLPVTDDAARLSTEVLAEWGASAHAGDLSEGEAKVLREALRGGEEAEFDDQTRWFMLRLLRTCEKDGQSEPALLSSCRDRLFNGAALLRSWDPAGRAMDRLLTGMQMVEPYEQVYQAALFVFDAIRAAATASGGRVALNVLAGNDAVSVATDVLRAKASSLLQMIEAATAATSSVAVRGTLQATGLLSFAKAVSSAGDNHELCREILARHSYVQEGKFDGGQPKGPWLRMETSSGGGTTAVLTQQRFGVETADQADAWDKMVRHPYRTFGAQRFIQFCGIQ